MNGQSRVGEIPQDLPDPRQRHLAAGFGSHRRRLAARLTAHRRQLLQEALLFQGLLDDLAQVLTREGTAQDEVGAGHERLLARAVGGGRRRHVQGDAVALHRFDLLEELDHLRGTRVKRAYHHVHLGELQEFHRVRRRFGGEQRVCLTQQLLQLGEPFLFAPYQQQCFHTPRLPVPPEA